MTISEKVIWFDFATDLRVPFSEKQLPSMEKRIKLKLNMLRKITL